MISAQSITDLFLFLALCIPLILSLLFMMRSLLVRKHNKAAMGADGSKAFFVVKMLLMIVMIITGSFLLLYLSVRFLLPDYEIPFPCNLIGIVLSGLYILGFGGIALGMGQIGHGGGSPAKIFRELFRKESKQ